MNKRKKKVLETAKKKIVDGARPKKTKLTPKIPIEMYLAKADARKVQEYTKAIVGKFGRYIKAVVVWGSKKTKTGLKKSSDIDTAIIVDDTDVQRMTSAQLKEKLFQKLIEIAYPIEKSIHPQPYLLTEFWTYVIKGNPVLHNVIRDGVVVYDTGFFLPLQLLMKRGIMKPSKEAVDSLMMNALDLLKINEETLTHKLVYNVYLSSVSAAQAVLMEMGYRTTSPKETPTFVREFLWKEHKKVSKEDVEVITELVNTWKDIEHKELKKVSGRELDALTKKAKSFSKKMNKLLKDLRKKKGETFLYESVEERRRKEFMLRRDGLAASQRIKMFNEVKEEQIHKDLAPIK